MDNCNAYFDGMFAGFMCMRKKEHGGKFHLWFIKGQGNNSHNRIYWTDEKNSWKSMYRKAK